MERRGSPEASRIKQISVEEAVELLRRDPNARLIDVREEFEVQIAAIPGAERLTEALAAELVERGDRDAPFVFSCHHGVRSLHAAAFFAAQGFKNVASMAGGIQAWSERIDPSIPTY